MKTFDLFPCAQSMCATEIKSGYGVALEYERKRLRAMVLQGRIAADHSRLKTQI